MADVNTALDLSTQTSHMQNVWSHASPSPFNLLNISVQSLRALKIQFSDFQKLSLTCYFHYTLCSIPGTFTSVYLYSKHIPWRGAMKLWTIRSLATRVKGGAKCMAALLLQLDAKTHFEGSIPWCNRTREKQALNTPLRHFSRQSRLLKSRGWSDSIHAISMSQ